MTCSSAYARVLGRGAHWPCSTCLFSMPLLCHLKQLGVGVTVAGDTLAAMQYADDLEPFLKALGKAPGFALGMDAFRQACGHP